MPIRPPTMSRRDLVSLFAFGGSAALLDRDVLAGATPPPLPRSPDEPTASYWQAVRAQFLIPADLSVLNAANLCPAPAQVLARVHEYTARLDREPVPSFRVAMHAAKEDARRSVAEHLRVSPDDVVLTRNTSEANNFVSSGLDLRAGDQVVIFEDNHQSNHRAWQEKARRFGYTVHVVPQIQPHPGADAYLEAFEKTLTPKTRVLAFTHITNTTGDVFPARELCRLARQRDVLSLVDGAQSFGLLDVDLSDMQPDFYTGSSHKWPCGPLEVGVLYIDRRAQTRLWPSIYSAYPGETGVSKTFEGMGQRDEPAIRAFADSLRFLRQIGQPKIEARARELGRAAVEALGRIDGVTVWTSTDPARAAAVVTFKPGDLDPAAVVAALERDGVVAAVPPSKPGRPSVRFSPHFYNSHADVEKAVAAIHRYLRRGL